MLTAYAARAAASVIEAAPAVTTTTPPGSEKFLMVAGWVLFLIGVGLVVAFAVGLVQVAWAGQHHQAGPAASNLAIKALCGAAFGVLGAIMNGLF